MESLALMVSVIFLAILMFGVVAGIALPFFLKKFQKWLRLALIIGCITPFWFVPNLWFIMPFTVGFLPSALICVFFQKQ